MERLSDVLRGYSVVRVVGAEPTKILDLCVEEGLDFWGAYPEDEFTMILKTRIKQEKRVVEIAEKNACEAEVKAQVGGPIEAKKLKRRPALWVLPVLLMALLAASSLFIWQIDITGNETVGEIEILNALEDSGVYIGSFHPAFTSDNIRSMVLVRVPALKWISVSVHGSRAVIEVRERTNIPELTEEDKGVKLIANHSGVIERMEVLQGNPLFQKGQAALEEETLIDGAVPSTFGAVEILHASGRVIARTWQELTAILPLDFEAKEYTGERKTRFALEFGEKRINFYTKSRIPDKDYDTIIKRSRLGIKDFFELPVILVKETGLAFDRVGQRRTESGAQAALEQLLNEELTARLGKEGSVISSAFAFNVVDGFAVCTLRAECLQNIAKEKEISAEEIYLHQAAGEEQTTR